MFGQAALQFAEYIAGNDRAHGRSAVVNDVVRRFIAFCLADVPRYQLLFQRTIPGFEPVSESYAHAVSALDQTRWRLSEVGINEARHVDMLTAMVTGLVDQQVSNDPGGNRWVCLVDELVDMFVTHCDRHTTKRRSRRCPAQEAVRFACT